MNLVKSILNIRFETATEPWLAMREILRSAAADPKAEIQAAPVVVDRPKDRKRIMLQVRAAGLEHELAGSDSSIKGAIKETLEIFIGLHKASPFPAVAQMSYNVFLIEPFPVPFHELVGFMKARYLLPSRLSDTASDIGLTFDRHEEGLQKHVQIGPMDKTQLQSQFLRWPAKGIPDTFVFLDLGYTSTVGGMAFSQSALESFLEQATDWQVAEAASVIAELKDGGG